MLDNNIARTGAASAAAGDALLYGSAWASGVSALRGELLRNANTIFDQFYTDLYNHPGTKRLLDTLSAEDTAQLRARQMRNLLTLATPDLTAASQKAAAMERGLLYSAIGMPRDELVHSYDMLHSAVHGNVDAKSHEGALSLLSRRLIRDLAWQMEAYRTMQTARYDLLMKITYLAWSVENYSDLINQVAQVLSQSEEVAGCSFGRPDTNGVFNFEVIAGDTMAACLADIDRSPAGPIALAGPGATGRVWYSRRIESCVNYATDENMAPWRDTMLKHGFRSNVAIPLCPPGQAPVSVLTLYSPYTGGFTAPFQRAFLGQLQAMLALAISHIENREGRQHTVSYAERLRWATELRSDALEMWYQPIFDLKAGRVTKVEALARLRDGNRVLTPGDFFPALSSDDFVELYARGLSKALHQRKVWAGQGLNLDIALNLPTSALADQRYYETTRDLLKKEGCLSGALTLEILETEDIPLSTDVAVQLARFKALGVNLAEDDLGTGHSGLSRLRELPFDLIKIDRNLVVLAGEDPTDVLRFIYQITRLGQSLGKKVVVEGVESQELLEAITNFGVDEVQGYAVAHPMPAAQLGCWLQSHRPRIVAKSAEDECFFAKLARLLLWEEHMYLVLHDLQHGEAAAEGETLPRPEDLIRYMPFGAVKREIQAALVLAAIEHGARSAEYGSARRDLVSALRHGSRR